MEKKESSYNVALYIRLSKEDGDKEESESVTNQRKILRAFAKDNKYNVYDEYVDDGYSGTNFSRPGFKRMIKDIEAKKVNMVITKTLSRLGRDYIETGRYIENYFPEHNVRYIAILDDVDTYLDRNSEMIAFKNVMNDYYAKETSKNIKRTKYKKIESGFYYTAYAPFGYKKIDEKGNIEIVESQANIVKMIYKEFLNGKGTYQIAQLLNSKKIPCPAIQIDMHSQRYNDEVLWNHNTIRRILSNQVYIGHIEQHKIRKVSYKSKKQIKVPKEEHVITLNHHTPIIDLETWNLAQTILEYHASRKVKENEQLLKPFIYCGNCYERMYIIKSGEKYKGVYNYRYHLACSSNKNGKASNCPNTYINYNKFEKNVLEKIHNQLVKFMNVEEINKKRISNKYNTYCEENSKNKIEVRRKKIESEIEEIDRKLKMLYNDRLNKIIDLDNYNLFSNKLNSQREILKSNLDETNSLFDNTHDEEKELNIDEHIEKEIKNIILNNNFSREELYRLIKKIEVDHNQNINIIFNFKELNLLDDEVENGKAV